MSQGLSLTTPYHPDASFDARLTRDVWPRRIVAFVIDMIVIAILAAALSWVVFVLGILTLGLGFIAWHLMPLVPPLYYIIALRGRSAATPGQRLMGLTVRRNLALTPPGFAEALVWTLLLGLSIALSFVPMLLVLVARRHRAAHDILAGLVVVNSAAIGPSHGL